MIRTLLAGALALVCATSASAATIPATCTTIAAAIAGAQGGDTVQLAGECGVVRVARAFPDDAPLVLDLTGATASIDVTSKAANLIVRGGTVRAIEGGSGKAMNGYGARIMGARVTFEGVGFTSSKKAVVVDRASDVAILNSRFYSTREDGVIASATNRLRVVGNSFLDFRPVPTSCTTPSGVIPGLSAAACKAKAGTWRDGDHADAVQLRNGVTDAVIADNVVFAPIQGLTQMDTTGDAPLQRITIERNLVLANIHNITLGANCIGCTIRWNVVGRYAPTSYRAVIRAGAARRCGNTVQDEKSDGIC